MTKTITTVADTRTDYRAIQLKLEQHQRDLGFEEFTKRLAERAAAGSISEKSALALADVVFKAVYRRLEDHLDIQKAKRGGVRGFHKVLLELDRYTVAYIAVVEAIAILGTKNTKRTTFEAKIGNSISDYHTDAVGHALDDATLRSIGALMFSMLGKAKLITYETKGKGATQFVQAFPSEMIFNLASTGILGSGYAKSFPMVVEPKPWTNLTNGGYLSIPNRLVRRATPTQNKMLNEQHPLETMAAVNKAQSVAWKIDTRVLDVVATLVDAGTPVGKMGDSKGDKAEQGRALRTAAVVSISEQFRSFPSIYFPHSTDNRGRVYPISSALSPQGGSVDKALLSFAKGEFLTAEGERWLSYHIANTYGLDKETPAFRFAWASKNEDLIARVVADPIGTLAEWSKKGTDALGFLKACYAWVDHKAGKAVDIPVSLDATCSGIQVWSALLKDNAGAQSVNLTDTQDLHDFYIEVLAALLTRLESNPSDQAKTILEHREQLTRTFVKQPSMTYSYGVTIKGVADALAIELKGSNWADYKLIFWLAAEVLEAIKTVVKGSAEGMLWLKSCVKASSDPVSFVTPSGFPFVQESFKKEVARGFTVSVQGDGSIRPSFLTTTEERDTAKDVASISPNVIHALDASLLTLIASKFDASGDLMLIHDSFGTGANHVGVLQDTIRSTFAEMFAGDLLGDIHTQLTVSAREESVVMPAAGTWVSTDMLNNPYAFS